jgi:hypothetical protein
MTGWEILREIKEGRAKKVKRAGNQIYTFYAANDSRVIKWYPIEISKDWTDEMISLKCADVDFPEKCVSEFLHELLAYDDWEVAEDEESLHNFEEDSYPVNDLKWEFCWLCKCNEAICPCCNKAICVSDCYCDVPQWRKLRNEAFDNNLVPKYPTPEEIEERRKHLLQFRLDQMFIDIEKDSAFLQLMEEKVNG